MVFITGDIHGNIERFLYDCFPEQKEMTKDDYVIIVGDFGVIFDTRESREERMKLKSWIKCHLQLSSQMEITKILKD